MGHWVVQEATYGKMMFEKTPKGRKGVIWKSGRINCWQGNYKGKVSRVKYVKKVLGAAGVQRLKR